MGENRDARRRDLGEHAWMHIFRGTRTALMKRSSADYLDEQSRAVQNGCNLGLGAGFLNSHLDSLNGSLAVKLAVDWID